MSSLIEQILEKPETIIASCALAISIISIGITLWQMCIQRKHNRISFMPIGKFKYGDYENSLFAKIENSGTGPLIIKKLIISKGKDEKSNLVDWLSGTSYTDFVDDFTNKAIAPNKKLYLFNIKPEELNLKETDIKTLRKELKDLRAKIFYEDVYGNSFTEERDLSHFGRLLKQ